MNKYDIFVVFSLAFLDVLGASLLAPLLSRRIRLLMGSHMKVGFLGSIYAGVQFFSGPFIGSLSDMKGRKKILIVTLFGCGTTVVLTGLTKSVTETLLLRGVFAFFRNTPDLLKGLVSVSENNAHTRTEILARISAISGAASAIGPFVSGRIVDKHPDDGFEYVTVMVGVCYTIAAGTACFLSKSEMAHAHNRGFVNAVKLSIHEIFYVKWTIYWKVFVLKVSMTFAMSLYYTNYIVYMLTVYDLNMKYIGYVISFQGVVSTLASLLMSQFFKLYKRDKDYSQRNFHIFLILNIGFIGVSLSPNIYYYVWWSIFIIAASTIGKLISLHVLLQSSDNQRRGIVLGALTSIKSITEVIAPITCGYISMNISVPAVIYGCIVVALIGLLASYKINLLSTALSDPSWHHHIL